MNKKKRTILLVVGALSAITLLAVLGLTALTRSMCGTDIVNKYVSPSGRSTIRHTVLNCGATTDFVTALDLGGLKGKIISIKGAHEDDLSAKWIDDKNIVVSYTGDSDRIYDYKTEVSGIKVQYKNGEKDLVVRCLYAECEKRSRELED
jgi:hypothetical protein